MTPIMTGTPIEISCGSSTPGLLVQLLYCVWVHRNSGSRLWCISRDSAYIWRTCNRKCTVSLIASERYRDIHSPVLDSHEAAFKNEFGLVSDTTDTYLQSQPRFFNPRAVPYYLRSEELERLEKAGIIEPVEFSEWHSEARWKHLSLP